LNPVNYRKIEIKIEPLEELGPIATKIRTPIKYSFNIKSFKSGVKSPLGNLWIAADELVRNGVSYFLKEKTGLFRSKVTPILLEDENPCFLLNVSTGRSGKLPLLFTGRRFLIAFNSFIQSKWIKPTFRNFFSLLGINYWKDRLLKETRYDGLSMSFRLSRGFLSKYVEIGWVKHGYQNGWKGKVYSPVGYTPYERKVKAEDFLNIISERAQKAAETDVLDLIALEDFCLTRNLEIYKVGFREFGSSKLRSGRLNLGKKKQKATQ